MLNFLLDVLYWIRNLILGILGSAFNHFMSINHFEKAVFINVIPAFFAATLPIAQFYIFNTWYGINNPYTVYLIFIVFIMFVTHFFRGIYVFALRAGLNIYYLAWVIYLGAAGAISPAPYEIASGYYMNLLVPVLYAGFAAGSYLYEEM